MRARSLAVVASAVVAMAACSRPPPPETAPPPPSEMPTASAEPAPKTQPPTQPSAGSDVDAVRARIAGTWETTVTFGPEKTATQTLRLGDDGSFTQTDAGTDKPTKTSSGRWSVVDGTPAKFTLQLELPAAKAASTWRLLDSTHLTTRVGLSDVVYVKKP